MMFLYYCHYMYPQNQNLLSLTQPDKSRGDWLPSSIGNGKKLLHLTVPSTSTSMTMPQKALSAFHSAFKNGISYKLRLLGKNLYLRPFIKKVIAKTLFYTLIFYVELGKEVFSILCSFSKEGVYLGHFIVILLLRIETSLFQRFHFFSITHSYVLFSFLFFLRFLCLLKK